MSLSTIMSSTLRVRFGDTTSGSLPVLLEADDQQLTILASHTPYDSLAELVTALIGVLVGDSIEGFVA